MIPNVADKYRDADVMAYWEYCRDLRDMLEDLEWIGVDAVCPMCHLIEPLHDDDCCLDALLKVDINQVFEVNRSRFYGRCVDCGKLV